MAFASSLSFDLRLRLDAAGSGGGGMSSRVWKILAAVIVAALSSGGAKAQDITMQGIARSISAHYYVRTVCPSFFKVDIPMASKIAADTLDLGLQMYDPAAFRAAVAAEVPRRGKEVSATGAQPWCTYQRTVMSSVGLGFLFK
jgi:hypothetical protein